MPSHKTNGLERVGHVQWEKLNWKGRMDVLDVFGMLCVWSSCGSARLLDLGSSFGKNIPVNTRTRTDLPSRCAWDWDQLGLGGSSLAGRREGSGRPGAAAGKPLLPSLAALPDKSQRESQPWKTLSL